MNVCALEGCGAPARQKFCTREHQLKARAARPALEELGTPAVHVVIPDTQVKPGVPTDHLEWAGRYIVDQFGGHPNLNVIHLGDHWDFPSLSSYDRGKKAMEGRRYKEDLAAGNAGFAALDNPLRSEEARSGWRPRRKKLLRGNHENRVERAVESDAQLDGILSLDDCDSRDWDVHDFLEIIDIDGVAYSHYFYRPNSGKPYASMPETRLKEVGRSFTMGHQQGIAYAKRPVANRYHRALIAGSFYQHNEEYRGPQASNEWRGIVVCHQVEDGDYDLMEVSMDFLCRKYEGHQFRDHVGVEL